MGKKRKLRRAELRAEKRKKELLHRRKRMQKMMAMAIMLIAVISIVVIVALSMNGRENIKERRITQPSQVISQTEVSIPLSEINSNAKFYTYDSEGVEIRYFAVVGSDGEVHIAFDACDVCYSEKKGYRQIGEIMHCINCGREFAINSIGTENTAGGCWPSFLPMRIDGDDALIEISDLEAKKYMF
jgi:uncharacterized membrane protein